MTSTLGKKSTLYRSSHRKKSPLTQNCTSIQAGKTFNLKTWRKAFSKGEKNSAPPIEKVQNQKMLAANFGLKVLSLGDDEVM